MTDEQRFEGNVLIAEFMGLEKCLDPSHKDNPCYYSKLKGYVRTNKLLYSTDWNLLMPVVEKIENIFEIGKHSVTSTIEDKQCIIVFHFYQTDTTKQHKTKLFVSNGVSKIEAIYKSVIEFIIWYNQQVKQP